MVCLKIKNKKLNSILNRMTNKTKKCAIVIVKNSLRTKLFYNR